VKMNSAMKAALISSKASCFHLRAALFHSTPVLERKRRNYWESVSLSLSLSLPMHIVMYLDIWVLFNRDIFE
jgi:hypothetical protein